MLPDKEIGLMVVLERFPIATDDAVVDDNGLKDAAIIVRLVSKVR